MEGSTSPRSYLIQDGAREALLVIAGILVNLGTLIPASLPLEADQRSGGESGEGGQGNQQARIMQPSFAGQL